MQYLLTQEEYDALVPKYQLETSKNAIELLRGQVLGSKCVHSGAKDRFFYCDECPLSHIGGSKRPSREESKAMCGLNRDYSK